MFKTNFETETGGVGAKIQLTGDVRVLKGTFTRGSVLTIKGKPDARGEFECVDDESGETVYLHPSLSSYREYSRND